MYIPGGKNTGRFKVGIIPAVRRGRGAGICHIGGWSAECRVEAFLDRRPVISPFNRIGAVTHCAKILDVEHGELIG